MKDIDKYRKKAYRGDLSLQEAEKLLTDKFTGQYVRFQYPGKKDIYGMCQRISIDTLTMTDVLIFIDRKQYRVEITELKNCLVCVKDIKDGNTGSAGDAAG